MKDETLVTEVAHRQEQEDGRDNGQTSNGNRGVTWNEEDDRKEKEISETLSKAEDEGTEEQQVEPEAGKSEDNTTSYKISESGIWGEEKEGENEKDDRKEKEISETLLRTEGEGTEGQQAELEADKSEDNIISNKIAAS